MADTPKLDGLLTKVDMRDALEALGSLDPFPLRLPRCRRIKKHDAALRALATWACQELCDRIEEKVDKENETAFIYDDINTWPDYQHAQAALKVLKG